MEELIQFENNVTQSIKSIWSTQLMIGMKKFYLRHFFTIPYSSSHIDEESWYLGDFNQDSTSPQNFKLE